MAVNPPLASSLNPNAPIFVPAAFFAAEDFSPEWWRLVQTSPGFREFWLNERFVGDGNDFLVEDLEALDDELDVLEDNGDLEFVFEDEMESFPDKALGGDDKTPLSLESHALVLKAGILDVLSPKNHHHHHYNPVVRREKVPQLVVSSPKNSPMKRIHQPR